MKMNYQITRAELDVIKKRAHEVACKMADGENAIESLIEYARDNGYTEEEARDLIKNKIIPTVDQYNDGCRAQFSDESGEWLRKTVADRVEGMTLEEECKYKLGVLLMLKAMSEDILKRASAQTASEMDMTFQVMSDDDASALEKGPYTEETLAQINVELAEAIENCGLDVELVDRFEQVLDETLDEESVHGFVTELWQDAQYKYAMAVSACVAKKNNELPSLPEDTSEEMLTIGVCQGIDVANVEARVSVGEMTTDKAYEVIRTIASVGVAIAAAAGMFFIGVFFSVSAFSAIVSGLGGGLIAIILGAAVGGSVWYLLEHDFFESVTSVAQTFRKLSDFTYKKLKQGVKFVSKVVKERVLPCLGNAIEKIGGFILSTASAIRRAFNRRKANVAN